MVTGNGHLDKMEGDRLLSEDPRAISCGPVRAGDVGVSAHSIHHDAQDMDHEGVASQHGSLTRSESAESQKERTSVPHSPSKKQINLQLSSGSSLYFRDGLRSVDFVLVWDDLVKHSNLEASVGKRKVFEKNLQREGLELEYEKRELNGLNFIKLHATLEVLRRYSEILKLRMPMKEIPGLQEVCERTNSLLDDVNSCADRLMAHFYVDTNVFPRKSHRFTAVYSRDREYLFDIHSEGFFTPAIRSRIVQFILDRQRFTEDQDDEFAFGIERLISELVYTAAYPLHDVSNHVMHNISHLLASFTFYTAQWMESLQSLLSSHNLSFLISCHFFPLLFMVFRTWLKHFLLGHPIVLSSL